MRSALRRVAPLLVLLAGACSHDADGVGDLGADVDLSADDVGTTMDLATACPRTPRPDDATRAIVVAHPYTSGGSSSTDFEVLLLDGGGTITQPGTHFAMGRAAFGTIAFTADGALGYVPQDDGTIGAFRLSQTGEVTVIEAKHKDTFYAGTLWVGPAGDHLYVLDSDTEANNGGIYDVPIACDGALGPATKLTGADVPAALVALPGGDLALYARKLAGAAAGQAVHRVQLGPPFSRLASATAFTTASDAAVIASATRTHDGQWVLFGDNSEFSGVENRIAAVGIGATGLGATQVVTPENDPVALIASPFDDVVLVVSGYDNAIRMLSYDPASASAPFASRGAITYMGAKPQLPGGAVLIDRGALRGRVYVAENLGVRQVRFDGGGAVTDLGRFPTGTGTENVVGAIGVTP